MGVQVIARVECRSEGAAEQHPIAVWLGRDRIEVGELISDVVEGPVKAGRPAMRRVRARLVDGQVFEFRRELPRGDWSVYRD